VVSFVAGLIAPITLDVQDGTNALVRIVKNMTGQGVQEGIEPFSTPLSALDDIVGTSVVIVFLIALVAGIVGVVRREPIPVRLGRRGARGRCVRVRAAAERPLLRAGVRVRGARDALAPPARAARSHAAARLGSSSSTSCGPRGTTDGRPPRRRAFATRWRRRRRYVEREAEAGRVALVPSYWPFADARFYELVQIYVGPRACVPVSLSPRDGGVRSFETAANEPSAVLHRAARAEPDGADRRRARRSRQLHDRAGREGHVAEDREGPE
jgi:hypothetical protein